MKMKSYRRVVVGLTAVLLTGHAVLAETKITLYPVSYMTRVIDTQKPAPADARTLAARKLSLFAAPGEYEPATFVIDPEGGSLEQAILTVTDLVATDGKARIAASAVDPFVVKCWYADIRDMWGTIMKKEYWPELLVKDEGIVQADHARKENNLKFAALPVIPDKLQPFSVAADGVKEIWLTVHVPEKTTPGRYVGSVTVRAGAAQASMPLELEVLDIGLCRSLADIGAFVTDSDTMDMGFDFFKLELADMASHGFNFPIISHPQPDYEKNDFSGLKKYLDAHKEAGILCRRAVLQNTGLTTYIWAASSVTNKDIPPDMQAEIRGKSKKLKAFLTAYDPAIEWYIYGMDEKAGEELARGARAQKIMREEGLKVLVATNQGDENLDYNLWFTYVWFAHHGMRPTIADYHEKGKRVGLYTQMSHFKDPVIYRYRAGFALWNQPMDGYAPWSYMDNLKQQWTQEPVGKQSAWGFVRPATNGLISTVQWEGFREGVDDYRYATTLATMVEKARQLNLKNPLLDQAEKLLARVAIQPYNITSAIQFLNPTQADYAPFSDQFPHEKLQEARRQIADLILALQEKFPALSTAKLKNDESLVGPVYRSKLARFSIPRFHTAHDESNKFEALRKEFLDAAAKRDWTKAGPLATQLKDSFAANQAIWAEQGFSVELPGEIPQVIEQFQKLPK